MRGTQAERSVAAPQHSCPPLGGHERQFRSRNRPTTLRGLCKHKICSVSGLHMLESAIGRAALPGLTQFSVGSAGCVAGVYDKSQQFVTHHPKSLPTTHPHSTLLLVPWDAGAERCARQASSLSTSREMKVQRSIGKKILAVVAGAGLAASGLLLGATPAMAEERVSCGTASGADLEAAQPLDPHVAFPARDDEAQGIALLGAQRFAVHLPGDEAVVEGLFHRDRAGHA